MMFGGFVPRHRLVWIFNGRKLPNVVRSSSDVKALARQGAYGHVLQNLSYIYNLHKQQHNFNPFQLTTHPQNLHTEHVSFCHNV